MTKEKRIRIGNQTAFSALTPMEPFEYAVESGFDAFEWFPDKERAGAGWEEKDLDVEARRKIKHTAEENDILLSVHVPWWINPLKPEATDRLLENVRFGLDIGASLLNIHLYTDEGIDAYVKAITPLIKALAEGHANLSIENTVLTGPDDFNELFARIRDLKVETVEVGMCLDLGHANLYAPSRNDYLRFIDQLHSHVPIIHIHAHENYGDFDSHLVLFTGPGARDGSGIQGFVDRMKKCTFSGSIVLEQWPQPPSLLNQARDRLYRMFDNDSSQPMVFSPF